MINFSTQFQSIKKILTWKSIKDIVRTILNISPGNYTMETPVTSSGAGNGTTGMIGEGQQILISGAGGDQQLVMSAEDAAQFFAQAGIQWDAGSGQVIVGDVQPQDGTTEGEVII